MDILLRILMVAVIAGTGALVATWPSLASFFGARRVHRRLAAVNGLTDRESSWLWRVAKITTPQRPAMVYVRPSLLEVGPATDDPELAKSVHDKLFSN